MSSKKLHSLVNVSGRSSSNSIRDQKYNLFPGESRTTGVNEGEKVLTNEEIEQELLRAFDTQMSFGQK